MRRNSPSSIIAYQQCPRYYFYRSIEKRPSIPHIDLIKGNIVHKTLEKFFSENPSQIDNDPRDWSSKRLEILFMKYWDSNHETIKKLQATESQLSNHYQECKEMLNNWLKNYLTMISKFNLPFHEAYLKTKPQTEVKLHLDKYNLVCVIDVIEDYDNEIRIIDYKTTSKFEINKEHRLQLGINAYLYEEEYGVKPDKVGVYFLKEKLHLISVDSVLINFAKNKSIEVFNKTKSNEIKNYPQNTGYLCKRLGDMCPCRNYEEEI